MFQKIKKPSKAKLENLAQQLVNSIKSARITKEWHDDHLACYTVEITLKDGKTGEAEFWWTDGQIPSLVKYMHESKTCRNDLANHVLNHIDLGIDCYNESDHGDCAEFELLKLAGIEIPGKNK